MYLYAFSPHCNDLGCIWKHCFQVPTQDRWHQGLHMEQEQTEATQKMGVHCKDFTTLPTAGSVCSTAHHPNSP